MSQWSALRFQMMTETLDILTLLLLSTDGDHLQMALMHEAPVPIKPPPEPKKKQEAGGLLSWLGFTEQTVKDELGMRSSMPHTAADFILGGLIRALQSPKMTTPQVDKGLSVLFIFIHGSRAQSVTCVCVCASSRFVVSAAWCPAS